MSARRRRRGVAPGAILSGFLAVVVIGLLAAAATSSIRLGLDLQGGIGVVLTAPEGTPRDVVDKAIEVIRNRVDALGVAEPDISRQGDRNIQVQLPGVKDRDTALRVIGTTAQLQFRPVLAILGPEGTPEAQPTSTDTATPTATPTDTATSTPGSATATDTATTTPTAAANTTATATSVTPPDQDITTSIVVLTDTTGTRYRLAPAEIVGADVKGAVAEQQQSSSQAGGVIFGQWQVRLEFTAQGEAKFKAVTGRLACQPATGAGSEQRQFAIVLDHVVQSAPRVADDVQCNQGISGGGVITLGTAENPQKEAQELATVLKFGALPAPFARSTVQEVSPTLGRESLRAGLIAGLIGLFLVAVYSVLYYRALGLVIVSGLFVFSALLFTITAFLSESRGLTLSLAGIAGIIVSVGITTDSYIVYFERIKEEVRSGRSVRSAVDKGFHEAFRTILAADGVTFLAAVVLYWLAISSVKGFALLLGISTLLDIAIVWFYKRNVVRLLMPTKWFSEGRFIGVSHTGLGAEPEPAR